MSQNSGAGIQTGGVHHARLTGGRPRTIARVLRRPARLRRGDGLSRRIPAEERLDAAGHRTAPDASKAAAGDRFDPNRVGLDRPSFIVGSHDDLEAAVDLCKARGVTCGEIVDSGPAFGFVVLMFEDPDGIQIELVANYA